MTTTLLAPESSSQGVVIDDMRTAISMRIWVKTKRFSGSSIGAKSFLDNCIEQVLGSFTCLPCLAEMPALGVCIHERVVCHLQGREEMGLDSGRTSRMDPLLYATTSVVQEPKHAPENRQVGAMLRETTNSETCVNHLV